MSKPSKKDQHTNKWMHNRAFIEQIDDEYCDWMIVATFYAAVHAVQALFAQDKVSGATTRVTRNQILKQANRYKFIWQHFRPLFVAAQVARYECSSKSWVPIDRVKDGLVGHHLAQVEGSVWKLLGNTEPLPGIKWPEVADSSSNAA